MVGILALIGGLAAACFVKAFGVAFLGRPRSAEAEHAEEVPLGMRVGLMLLARRLHLDWNSAGACLCVHWSRWFKCLIPGAGVPEETLSIARIIPWIAAIVFGTGARQLPCSNAEKEWRGRGRAVCPELSSRMQYTSTVFSKPIRFVFSRVYRPDRKVERLPRGSAILSRFHLVSIGAHDLLRKGPLSAIC